MNRVETQAEAETRLREAAQLAEMLLESASEGTYGVDLEGLFTFANRAAERMLGLSRAELIGRDMHALVHHSHPDGSPYAAADCPITLALATGKPVRVDDEVLWTKAGEPLPVAYSASPVRVGGQIAGAVVTFTDIRRRQAAERKLQESETDREAMFEDYRALFANHPEPMWVYALDTLAFLDVNNAAIETYGYSRDEFLAMTIRDIRPPEDVEKLERQMAGATHADRSGPWRHLSKAGVPLEVEITSRIIDFADRPARLVMAQDVTERRRLEAFMERTERLNSIGKLAGGVAHDFNNLLSVIINYATFVREAVPVDPSGPHEEAWRSVEDDVRQIERAAARATALTQQLLSFARRDSIQVEVINVNDVVKELEAFLHRTLVGQVELVTSLAGDLAPVLMDAGKLQQVLMNLAINARDAMPNGGTLTIITDNFEADPQFTAMLPGMSPGRYVRVRVSDTGKGMTEEVRERAFEPFFTTKKSGEGTGLGLATVYGIVTQSGGEIHLESTASDGTTFSVILPEHAEAGESAAGPE